MKKHNNFTGIFLFLIMILLLGMAISCSGTSDDSGMYAGIDGETLYRQALELEGKAYYFSACDYYKKARLAFLSEKNDEKAAICKWKALDMQKITDCYSISAENLPEAMKAYNSSFTNEDLKLWLAEGRLECLIIEGSPWYYENCFSNLSYYYPDVFARDEKLQASVNGFTWMILNYLNSTRSGGMKISNPRRFEASRRFCIRRNLLPVIGTLRIWIPYPINSDAQKEIETVKISPAEFHKEGPNTDSDIGSVYLEVPLEQLKNDLEVEVIVRFTHHEKSFHIDPDKVGEYDVNSELYRKYTGPSFNTAITDEIRQKAFQIVGDETNPYIKAKLINEYICKNIKYGLIPLSANEAMNLPVSVYVHESKRGDCGAQGVYFSALCRAVGVPARATGGFELWVPGGSGHFWSEFYLPDYGWVPLDPSLSVVASLSTNTTEDERKQVMDYLFGNLDPFRLIIQNDTDLELSPSQLEPSLLNLSFQIVRAECEQMEEDPTILIMENTVFTVNEIKQ